LCFDPDTRQIIESHPKAKPERRYPLVLGFRRLSILDTSERGHQPMLSLNGGRYAIVYNGELYNFQELRAELIARGCSFRSNTDTEVLLWLYELYGPAMLSRLNGMFALAILDRNTQILFLARDQMGIKPLYYYTRNGCLFASEVKAFLYHPAFEFELDSRRLSEFFLFRYIAGTHTLLQKRTLSGTRHVHDGWIWSHREAGLLDDPSIPAGTHGCRGAPATRGANT
jgi:asparagine synthase (glutamine-hydrolysing)